MAETLDARCAKCARELDAESYPLTLVFCGGYDGFIDTLEHEPRVDLCGRCAIEFVEACPWAAPLLQCLNINVGHECLDGRVHWIGMSECVVDPDRHGWAQVYVVAPRRHNGAVRDEESGRMVRFGQHPTEAAAHVHAAALRDLGLDVEIYRSLSGNERNFGIELDAATWLATKGKPSPVQYD